MANGNGDDKQTNTQTNSFAIPGHVAVTGASAPIGYLGVLALQAFGVDVSAEQAALIVPAATALFNYLAHLRSNGK